MVDVIEFRGASSRDIVLPAIAGLVIEGETKPDRIVERQVYSRFGVLRAVIAGRLLDIASELAIRLYRHEQDRAARDVAAKQGALRSLRHLRKSCDSQIFVALSTMLSWACIRPDCATTA
jgi:hypothetical protein